MSLSTDLKVILQSFLAIETSILWNHNQELNNTGYGFVNFYKTQYEETKVNPTRFSPNYTQFIEFGVTFSAVSKNDCDNKVLELTDLTLLAIRKLQIEGVPNTLPVIHNYRPPTLFKGITIEETRKELEQLSTGNQMETTDQLWRGTSLIYSKFRL